jgi:hypothetical protein
MKKFMTLMLGLSLVLGATAFAQETKTDTPKKEKKAKKSSKKKSEKTDTNATQK